MKKATALFLITVLMAGGTVFAAKYKVNTSGVVKTQNGKVISSPSNSVNQNYYNNYQAQNYIASNQVNAEPVSIIEFVMDYSGSMANWIGVAQRSMAQIASQIPASTNVGFRVFGHDNNGSNPTSISTVKDVKKIIRKGNKFKIITERGCLGTTSGICSATMQVTPITPININALVNGMSSAQPGGATPLVFALDRTVEQDFAPFDRSSMKKIILITDGGENCGGDPCAFAKKLMQKRNDVHIDVVLVSSSSKSLSCLANTTGGHMYTINNLGDFSTVINNSMQAQPVVKNNTKQQKYEYVND